MRPALPFVALTLAASVASASCVSTSYQPRNLPYLKTVQHHGQLKWQTGDRVYSFDMFSGGLEDATRAVPEASKLAAKARTSAVWGLVLTSVGPAFFAGGILIGILGGVDDPVLDSTTGTILGATLAVGGLAMMIAGFHEMMSAQAYQLDAINIYNDTMWLKYLPEEQASEGHSGTTNTTLSKSGSASSPSVLRRSTSSSQVEGTAPGRR